MNDATRSYLETALWSSSRCDDEGKDLGPFDDEYGPDDFDAESLTQATKDVSEFIAYVEEKGWLSDGHSYAQVAHDFWLTRNRHGAGFWDGDYEHGEALTEWAHAYGSVDVLEIGNGKVGLS
jgi:hypothetical protein